MHKDISYLIVIVSLVLSFTITHCVNQDCPEMTDVQLGLHDIFHTSKSELNSLVGGEVYIGSDVVSITWQENGQTVTVEYEVVDTTPLPVPEEWQGHPDCQ